MQTLQELEKELSECECWDDRFDVLMDLGFELPDVPENVKSDENLVRGCQSSLWAACSVDSGKLTIVAYSDAVVVRGIIAVVKLLVDGKPAEKVDRTDILGWFRQQGILERIGVSRRNGIGGLVDLIHSAVAPDTQPPM